MPTSGAAAPGVAVAMAVDRTDDVGVSGAQKAPARPRTLWQVGVARKGGVAGACSSRSVPRAPGRKFREWEWKMTSRGNAVDAPGSLGFREELHTGAGY